MISVSDAGGIGGPPTENGENVQNAHLNMVADDENRQEFRPRHHHLCGVPLDVSVLSILRSRERRSRCLQRSQTRSGRRS